MFSFKRKSKFTKNGETSFIKSNQYGAFRLAKRRLNLMLTKCGGKWTSQIRPWSVGGDESLVYFIDF